MFYQNTQNKVYSTIYTLVEGLSSAWATLRLPGVWICLARFFTYRLHYLCGANTSRPGQHLALLKYLFTKPGPIV